MLPKETNYASGKRGERIAEDYLKKQGYRILERNYRCSFGEIDLIAEDGSTLVFVEVKWRKDASCGYPEEAVHHKKIEQLGRLASHYLSRAKKDRPCRFD